MSDQNRSTVWDDMARREIADLWEEWIAQWRRDSLGVWDIKPHIPHNRQMGRLDQTPSIRRS